MGQKKFDFKRYDYRFSLKKFMMAEDKCGIYNKNAEDSTGREVMKYDDDHHYGRVKIIGIFVTPEMCVKKKKEENQMSVLTKEMKDILKNPGKAANPSSASLSSMGPCEERASQEISGIVSKVMEEVKKERKEKFLNIICDSIEKEMGVKIDRDAMKAIIMDSIKRYFQKKEAK